MAGSDHRLSRAAARELDMIASGTAMVSIERQ
jgi:rare lipoprotein A (peptidoglycan hydrolase)